MGMGFAKKVVSVLSVAFFMAMAMVIVFSSFTAAGDLHVYVCVYILTRLHAAG